MMEFLTTGVGYHPEDAAKIENSVRRAIETRTKSAAARPIVQTRVLTIRGVQKRRFGTLNAFTRLATLKRREAIHAHIATQMDALGAMFKQLSEIDTEMYTQMAEMSTNDDAPPAPK